MARATTRSNVINDFLASAHIFANAMNEVMENHVNTVLGGEITMAQLKLLKLVAKTGPQSIRDVAAFMRVSNAAASKSVDRLVRRDLIRRTESTDDRRAMQLSLTSEGQQLLQRYEALHRQALQGLFDQFGTEDFAVATELLDRLSVDLVKDLNGTDELCFRCGVYFREHCLLRTERGRSCYYHRFDRGSRTRAEADRKTTVDRAG